MERTYMGADGTTYTESDLWRNYETGAWRFCMGDSDKGLELVELENGELLMLSLIQGRDRVELEGRERDGARATDDFRE